MAVPFNLTKLRVDPVMLAKRSGLAQIRACQCPSTTNYLGGTGGLRGLGFTMPGAATDILQAGQTGSVLDAVTMGASFVPGVGPLASSVLSIFSVAISAFQNWLGIGKGRAEADIIVPVQDELINATGNGRLDQITQEILVGRTPSVEQLQNYYLEVWQLALGFMEFVLNPEFVDRRASGQALNTIFPYIDGTCGYPEPLGLNSANPGQRNCITWGAGTLGGPGTDGMLGAIGRAIELQGGTVPQLGNIAEQAAGGVTPETVVLPPNAGGHFSLSSVSPQMLAAGVVGFLLLKKFGGR